MLQRKASTHFPAWHYPGRFDGYNLSRKRKTNFPFSAPQMRYAAKVQMQPEFLNRRSADCPTRRASRLGKAGLPQTVSRIGNAGLPLGMELLTVLEWIATICGLVHVFLLTREKVIAWPFGIATVSVYVYIFYVSKLYSDTLLHIFYIFINCYGWYNWARRSEATEVIHITRLRARGIALLVGVIAAGTIGWGYFMDTQTDAAFPYGDAFTTAASLSAQYLLTQKKWDNWVVWIAVNVVAMPIYFMKGLYVTVGLYAVYLGLAVSGLVAWWHQMKERDWEPANKAAGNTPSEQKPEANREEL